MMNATSSLTWEAIEEARKKLGDPVRPLRIQVYDFQEQFRFPRTKKRRIRKKWAQRKENYRPKRGQCFKVSPSPIIPGAPTPQPFVVMGPDVKRELDIRMAAESKN